MVILNCAVVGEAENAFPVDIDGGQSVGELKEAIAGELKYTERADQLQLFMAKKKDGTWLDGAGAIQASVALDERGRPQGFAVMNPILFIKNPKHFGDNFQPGEGQIHVLVVVPVERAAKRQKVEPSVLAGAWSTVAGQMVELSKDLKPNDLEEGKMLAVPTQVFGTVFLNGLYIRQEYWELYRIIQRELASDKNRSRVLVMGSPEIGKSVFGVFLLLLFMTKKKNVAFRAPRERVVYFFTWSDTNGYEISNSPRDKTSYEGFFDGSEREGGWGGPHFLHVYLFASPNTENYNDFVKEMCFRVIMNPWTKTECQSLADINCIGDQDDWYHKFYLVGGRPRFVFSSETFDDLVRRVKANIPQNQSTLEDTVQLFKHERLRDDMRIPFLFRRDPDTPSRPFLTYASVAVEAIIANKARYRGDAV